MPQSSLYYTQYKNARFASTKVQILTLYMQVREEDVRGGAERELVLQASVSVLLYKESELKEKGKAAFKSGDFEAVEKWFSLLKKVRR